MKFHRNYTFSAAIEGSKKFNKESIFGSSFFSIRTWDSWEGCIDKTFFISSDEISVKIHRNFAYGRKNLHIYWKNQIQDDILFS